MILGMAVGLLTYLAQQRLETLQSLSALPLADRFDNALASYAEYLRKALLPFDLCASYVRTSPVPVGTVLTSVGLLSSISVLAVRAWRHRPVTDALYFANAGLNLAHRLGDRESLLEGTRRRLAYATKQSQAEASARPIE